MEGQGTERHRDALEGLERLVFVRWRDWVDRRFVVLQEAAEPHGGSARGRDQAHGAVCRVASLELDEELDVLAEGGSGGVRGTGPDPRPPSVIDDEELGMKAG